MWLLTAPVPHTKSLRDYPRFGDAAGLLSGLVRARMWRSSASPFASETAVGVTSQGNTLQATNVYSVIPALTVSGNGFAWLCETLGSQAPVEHNAQCPA